MTENNRRKLLWASVVVSAVPAFFLIPSPSSISLASVSLWLADTSGYVGIVLLLWMYALGTKSVMGIFFTDIAPVLSIHKKIGKWGTLAVLAHPLLVTLSYGESLLYMVIPELGTEFGRHVTLGRIAFLLMAATALFSIYFKKRVSFRLWKYIHYLAYIALPFALLHVPDVGSGFLHQAVVRGYFGMLVGVFLVISLLKIWSLLNLDKHRYAIVDQHAVSPIDRLLTLKPTRGYVIPRPGQFVYIKLGFISEDHPFSVLYYDQKTHELFIGYRIFGMFTKELDKLQSGASLRVGGPYGSFMSDLATDDTRPVVFISGGIGITPFIERITHENTTREQWLFAANRNRELAAFVPDVKTYLGERLISVYDKEETDLVPGEERGYITAELLAKYLTDPQKYQYYFCGPPPMKKAIYAELQKLGIPPENIQSEKFGW